MSDEMKKGNRCASWK